MSTVNQRMILSLFVSVLASLCLMPIVGVITSPHAYAAVDEQEPNNDFNEANEVTLNNEIYGEASENFETAFSDCADEDYFKVNLPKSGSVNLTFVNDRYENNPYYYADCFYVYIYNKHYEQVGRYEYTTRSTRPVSTTLSLSKGVNYLRIYCYRYGEPDHPYHFKLAYNIPATSITKMTPAKKKFTVKWDKKSGAYKYQVRYSTKKSMSGAKTITVSKATTAKTIKAKGGKKYFVQVRVAKSIGNQVYWSKWSSKKSVTTKK